MLCVWSREVKEKHYNTQAITVRKLVAKNLRSKFKDLRGKALRLTFHV